GVKAPDGYPREVYLINGQQPGPLVEADEGDVLEINVQNELDVENTVHWHGLLQRGTPEMDGVPGVTQFPIAPGANFTYRIPLGDQYGFYWYHSHFKTYYNDAIRGSLIVHPSPFRQRPFESLARSDVEQNALLQAEKDAIPVLLTDWYHNLSNAIYDQYIETGAYPNCVDSLLANGQGRSAALLPSGSSSTADIATPTGSLGPRGCTPPMMFKPGYNMSSLPPETCTNTTSPVLTITANQSQGWLALHLVNAGSTSKLSVSLDAHFMYVYAADGLFVELQEVKVLPISIGQRYSVMIKLDQPPGQYYLRFASLPVGDMQQVIEDQAIISYQVDGAPRSSNNTLYDSQSTWMLVNGSAKHDGSTLDAAQLAPFDQTISPAAHTNQTRTFEISQTGVVTWVVNGSSYSEPSTPVIFGNISDGWTAGYTLHMPANATVDIIMKIANSSMDTMGHPMHLHGHKFWVLGTGTGSFPYTTAAEAPKSMINVQNPPYRDTVELPASGWAVIRFITQEPGSSIVTSNGTLRGEHDRAAENAAEHGGKRCEQRGKRSDFVDA
ncbi:hypothetical protein B0A55_11642, partial [Friedmanniomyces simplex]